MILALAGGVGGAKLVEGLAKVVPPGDLSVIVNTGDDFEHFGLHISPDLDTVMYTMAGVVNPVAGWGLEWESWNFMDSVERLGGPTWFRLGDRDLATHAERTRRLALGDTLSTVTHALCERLGVPFSLSPMSDDPVRTMIRAGGQLLPFQHYFVKERCQPVVDGLEYSGALTARASSAFKRGLECAELEATILCPSNPYLSIAPMLHIPGVAAAMKKICPVIAVSPIIAGKALKGPAAKIMAELGSDVSVLGVARYYAEFIDTLVIDHSDARWVPQIESLGISVLVTDTVMRSTEDRVRLAQECVSVAQRSGLR